MGNNLRGRRRQRLPDGIKRAQGTTLGGSVDRRMKVVEESPIRVVKACRRHFMNTKLALWLWND